MKSGVVAAVWLALGLLCAAVPAGAQDDGLAFAAAIAPMQALVSVNPDYYWGWQQLADWYNETDRPQNYLEAAGELVPPFPSRGLGAELGDFHARGALLRALHPQGAVGSLRGSDLGGDERLELRR